MSATPVPPLDAAHAFLNGRPESLDAYLVAVDTMARRSFAAAAANEGTHTAVDEPAVRAALASLEVCPPTGVPIDELMAELDELVFTHLVKLHHPATVAHLHVPPTIMGAAADAVVALWNQSMDSLDQSPSGTHVEDLVTRWLAGRFGLPRAAAGVFTAGGTASNQLAMLLARNEAGRRSGVDVHTDGLPPDAHRWRILTSEASHFSIEQAAGILGLGRNAVVPIGTDTRGRMSAPALTAELDRLTAAGLVPICIVGTAGTTDLGAVDPLEHIAAEAARVGAWFHADAAVGSALVVSERLKGRLAGIEAADSITADFHKLWWQPISSSALCVRDERRFGLIRLHAEYLNRVEDEAEGTLNLVTRSLDTTRRFDALKVWIGLRAAGADALAGWLEHLIDLANETSGWLRGRPGWQVALDPELVMVLFRPELDLPEQAVDAITTEVQRSMFEAGEAVLGRTRWDGRWWLKFTLVQPQTTHDDLRRLIERIEDRVAHLTRE